MEAKLGWSDPRLWLLQDRPERRRAGGEVGGGELWCLHFVCLHFIRRRKPRGAMANLTSRIPHPVPLPPSQSPPPLLVTVESPFELLGTPSPGRSGQCGWRAHRSPRHWAPPPPPPSRRSCVPTPAAVALQEVNGTALPCRRVRGRAEAPRTRGQGICWWPRPSDNAPRADGLCGFSYFGWATRGCKWGPRPPPPPAPLPHQLASSFVPAPLWSHVPQSGRHPVALGRGRCCTGSVYQRAHLHLRLAHLNLGLTPRSGLCLFFFPARRRVSPLDPPPPSSQTKVTIVGRNEIYNRGNPVTTRPPNCCYVTGYTRVLVSCLSELF